MLSTKILLKNDRYRLDDLISAGPTARLYRAFDNRLKQPVIVLRTDGAHPRSDEHDRVQHDGLVRIADKFTEGPDSYLVTEPIAENVSSHERSADNIFRRLSSILVAISTLRTEFPTIQNLEISPITTFTTADRKIKLLSTFPSSVVKLADPVNSPYLPLEMVWDELDHINQKAIYRTYDENAMAVLESPADARSDLYSLGAVFYKTLTGLDPMSAFERSIDMLDTRVDPLVSPSKLNPEISEENSAFIVRLLELRRERRFGSTEDAIFSLPKTVPQQKVTLTPPTPDDVDLLEIPAFSEARTVAPPTVKASVPAAVPAAAPKPPVAQPRTVEAPTPPKPLFMEMAAEDEPAVGVDAAVFEAEEPVAAVIIEKQPESDPFSEEVFMSITASSAKQSRKPLFAAIFAFAAILIGVGAWGFFAFNAPKTSAGQPAATISIEPPQIADIPNQVPVEAAPLPAATIESTSLPSDQPDVRPVTDTNAQQVKPRPQIAEAKPAKPAEKRATEEKPKKKLTVDDLINDN